MIVVPGSASLSLARSLADTLDVPLADVENRRFPDGECYVRLLSSLDGEDAIVVNRAYPDEKIVETLLLQDAVREAGAKRITTVLSYMGYSRQDKLFNPGEAISARAMARMFSLYSDAVVTVDIHDRGILRWFDVPVEDVSGMPALAEKLETMGVEIVLSPDKGALHRARTVGEMLAVPWDHLEKTRLDGEHVVIKPKDLNVKGKIVAIVDDMISTGGTVVTAAGQLRDQGARRIIAACTHGLFVGNALERVRRACDAVISTDTIENPTTSVTVAREIAGVL